MVESMTLSTTSETNVTTELSRAMAELPPSGRSGVSVTSQVLAVSALPNGVLVASPGIFSEGNVGATAHLVIHDPSTLKALKTVTAVPHTPPSNPSSTAPVLASPGIKGTVSSSERKYTWDPSVLDPVLPVRCRNIRGELHKNRFGSGGRGRSIRVGDEWFTPSEFEAHCGRASSKDWKRSIRYAGRTLQCLIEEGFLQPHATSCTCSACCDNAMVVSSVEGSSAATSGPIRLFTPYKRRRKQEKQKNSEPVISSTENSTSDSLAVSLVANEIPSTSEIQVTTTTTPLLDVTAATAACLAQNIGNACPESVIVTPVATPQTPRSAPTALDFNEQRHWWQLEEMAKNIVCQAQELQKLVETVKAQSAAARDSALQQLKIQMENEKKEALNASRVEAQMNLSRAILEAKAEKELALEQALQRARLEMQEKLEALVTDKGETLKRCANCDREAFSECTGCHRVSYCSTFCQRKDWQNHQEDCGDSVLGTEDCIEEFSEECKHPEN